MQTAIDFWLLMVTLGGVAMATIAGIILHIRNK